MTHKKSKITIGILLLKNIRYLQLNIYSLISFSVLFFFCYFLQFSWIIVFEFSRQIAQNYKLTF